ncbi:MAG TPA: hypothetical protein VJI71_01620, partial [Candidatus Norongarragalinales archaeon]|nr:hypothetical protein [Candidatus Norongarragalinales archaeon]
KDSAEPQSRIDWVRQNKSKLAVTGVTPVALIADREILIHPYQGGRKLTEDQQIDLLVKLDENGLASHNAIEHGHFRIDEKGIHLIPA